MKQHNFLLAQMWRLHDASHDDGGIVKLEPWWCSVVLRRGDILFFNNEHHNYKECKTIEEVGLALVLPERRLRMSIRHRHPTIHNAVVKLTAGKLVIPGSASVADWPWYHVGYYRNEKAKEMLLTYARMLEGS